MFAYKTRIARRSVIEYRPRLLRGASIRDTSCVKRTYVRCKKFAGGRSRRAARNAFNSPAGNPGPVRKCTRCSARYNNPARISPWRTKVALNAKVGARLCNLIDVRTFRRPPPGDIKIRVHCWSFVPSPSPLSYPRRGSLGDSNTIASVSYSSVDDQFQVR